MNIFDKFRPENVIKLKQFHKFLNRCCFRCKTCRYTLWDETAMNSHLRKCPWLAKTGQKRAESETVVRNVYRCKGSFHHSTFLYSSPIISNLLPIGQI